MKNDFRGKKNGQPVTISVPPTLLMTAVAKVSDVKTCRTSDFKAVGDLIFVLGGGHLGLLGSELQSMLQSRKQVLPEKGAQAGEPDWDEARRIYRWIGGAAGRENGKLKSLHDVSDGGLLVTVAESLLARNLGAHLTLPAGLKPWELCFGEGFHTFVASCAESDAAMLEAEWTACNVPFRRLGVIDGKEKLEVTDSSGRSWTVSTRDLRTAWLKGGYWE
jgi:phosphoribosylformylglycinamidine (FGAM) synthase-like enzyme